MICVRCRTKLPLSSSAFLGSKWARNLSLNGNRLLKDSSPASIFSQEAISRCRNIGRCSQPSLFNKAKSSILMKPLSKNIIKKTVRFFDELERSGTDALVYFNFEAFGGKISKNHTSFFPREAFGWWFQAYYWALQKQSSKMLALSRNFYDKVPAKHFKYCYANIIDYDLGKRYLKAYWGDHVDRLIRVKNKYDPTNFFHWKQSIPIK